MGAHRRRDPSRRGCGKHDHNGSFVETVSKYTTAGASAKVRIVSPIIYVTFALCPYDVYVAGRPNGWVRVSNAKFGTGADTGIRRPN